MNETPETKQKLPFTHSAFLKVLALILAPIMLATVFVGIMGAVLMIDYDLYNISEERFYEELVEDAADYHGERIMGYVGTGQFEEAVNFINRKNIDAAEIICTGAQNWTWDCGSVDSGKGIIREFTRPYYDAGDGQIYPYSHHYDYGYYGPYEENSTVNQMEIRLRIAENPVALDEYYLIHAFTGLTYSMLYAVYPLIAVAAIAFFLCLAYLIAAAGHRRGKPGVTPGRATAIPFDLLTAVVFGLGVLSAALIIELSYFFNVLALLLITLVLMADTVIALLWLMSLALRLKLGKWWRGTIIYRLLRLVWRGLKWTWRKCLKILSKIWKGAARIFGGIGLYWKASIIFAAVCVLEFIVILATQWGLGAEVVLWFIEKLVFLTGLIFLCGFLNELYKCGKNVAEGNMDYEVNTRGMPSQFREHAENLRSLSGAVSKAVEQRMVSERMKTELITNVSHDLKTPLTSLINYSDLICRESCDNPKHGEYAEVLNRQSQRMKRLIDDLVEASKASSGNLDIELAPLRADVLLAQAAGEYEQRFAQQGLTCVVKSGDKPVSIMADGRRLWRVLDNLMSNICKYAMPGTRVYLALEEKGASVELSFKNTSREMLDLSPEELMERFVRGDSSRSSEGSGLGLSIARSLTQLQGGEMDIICDGDLFKVTLTFPAVK